MSLGNDFSIVSDSVVDGVRHITATPSSLVCSKQIDFDIVDGKLHNVKYVRGCNGNLQAVGRLLEGMEPQRAIDILSGVNCHGRGTSCSDQLTRILREALSR